MSTVSGTISVNVEFRDSTASSGVQSLKTIALREATEYTTGKVAIVTGTVGTAALTLFSNVVPITYKDSSGETVVFSSSSIKRVVASSPQRVEVFVSGPDSSFMSVDGRASVVATPGDVDFITVAARPSGTASYTIVLYGT